MKRQIDIPLVQQDLSHEETLLQITLSLEKLGKVVVNLFDNVNEGIARQQKQLGDIQRRCDAAKRKVDQLTGIDKSIQVFSSSKFPGPTPPTFYPVKQIEIQEETREIRIPFTPLPQDKLSMNEKLKFYHIKDSTLQMRKNESITPSEGLGEIPRGLKTVNSLLLYNTKQNLYAQYKILDPLTPPHRHIVVEGRDTRPDIGPAPLSLAAVAENVPSVQNYFYSPSLQDVPDINAPLNLPNLSGIAGDLRFGETDQIDFPRKKETKKKDIPEEISPGPEAVQEITDISRNSTETSRDNTENSRHINETSSKVPEPKKAESPAPPPPPPPPPLPPPDLELPTPPPPPKAPPSAPKLPPATDSRADLMAAIRNAGGSGKAKLKPVAEGGPDPVKTSGKPGNFMEDLHAKLSMRRKGISGKQDAGEGPGVGMLDRINSMIPPPPPRAADHEASADDSDWEE